MTAKQIGEQPAFPLDYYLGANLGMTYRQWLVGMAMQGMLAQTAWRAVGDDQFAAWVVKQADAVLDELAKEPSA